MRGRPEHDVHRQADELLSLTAPATPAPIPAPRRRSAAAPRPLTVVITELRAAWATVEDGTRDTAAQARLARLRAELATLVAGDGAKRAASGAHARRHGRML